MAAACLVTVAAPSRMHAQSAPLSPERFRGTGSEAVVALSNDGLGVVEDSAVAAMVRSCRALPRLSDPQLAEIVGERPQETERRGEPSVPHVVLAIVPVHPSAPNCRAPEIQFGVLAMRGVRFGFGDTPTERGSVTDVVVSVGERDITPLASERFKVRSYGLRGFGEPAQTWVRVALRLEDVAPDEDGRFPRVTLRVRTLGAEGSERYDVPEATVERLWAAALPRLGAVAGRGVPPIRLPLPRDSILRGAHARFEAGALGEAAQIAAAHVLSATGRRDERYWAYATAGISFASLGRPDAARVAFLHALRLEPCFSLDTSAPDSLRSMVDELRPDGVVCRPLSPSAVAVRALFAQGIQRPIPPRVRGLSWLTPVAMVAAALVAVDANQRSRRTYDEYLAWQGTLQNLERDPNGATKLYEEAAAQRRTSIVLWTAAVSTYGIQAFRTVRGAAQFRERLSEVDGFGAPSVRPPSERVGFSAVMSPHGAGVALRIFW